MSADLWGYLESRMRDGARIIVGEGSSQVAWGTSTQSPAGS